MEEELTLDVYFSEEYQTEMKARTAEIQEAASIKDPEERQNALRAVKEKYGY